jgi:hypothetical protein
MEVETIHGTVKIKLMSVQDYDNVIRKSRKLQAGGMSEETADVVANLLYGIEAAPFDLTEESILKLDFKTAVKVVNAIGEVNNPLEEENQEVKESSV